MPLDLSPRRKTELSITTMAGRVVIKLSHPADTIDLSPSDAMQIGHVLQKCAADLIRQQRPQ